jgi:hypothetical protein
VPGYAMAIVIGLWFAVAGLVAALAGLTARGRARRLRRSGRSAWGMVVPGPMDADAPRRNLIQYPLEDGRVSERPRPPRAVSPVRRVRPALSGPSRTAACECR